ncbi:BREX system P-loop protein BrxC [Isobaculum melis]|uniref:BREX system P-loop protein BrxC n=1 Tax=Isobaculum melis TaxID=142588 RepID=A0A1H9RMA1_9LACT|nr:BREX system P-loop protein BrxC [Isobaculum melis]SER73834.1 hypothetical protein SAMN04488559_104160 [Isobaculum melis]
MKIENLFTRPINREVKGVIKIGQSDDESVFQELDEYVVTQELQGHFRHFFDAYQHALQVPTDQMGVWISGFFGSGKSHFLKIISYLLDTKRIVQKRKPVDFFEEKMIHKSTLEKMKMASKGNNDVILFNVDSKSEADSKQNKLAIVKVFNKVFNELLGYSPSIPWLAQLEEILNSKGQYEEFKKLFEIESGLSWIDGRDEIYYNEDAMILALSKATEMSVESARKWITNGEENYEISVESFAIRLAKFVSQQNEDYRLIFLADEMGQYISENTQLMLNLQTLVEDIGKLTNGKVWIIVTSQQDIDTLKHGVSSMNDFSKIQSRFHLRLSLSSANADEVIKKRLLDKTDVAKETLKITYQEIEAGLKNKLSFSEHTVDMKTFKDAEDFASVYPFVPYQFHLLQKVFTGIREHGSAGKHLADGERNLLEAIQQAAISYQDKEIGVLVPFQNFYESIDQALEHSVRSTIIKAQQSETLEVFDISVLKLLFLIRYVKEMPANIDNLTTLMVQHVDDDKVSLMNAINDSLKRLEQHILIQRKGEEYVFLTNEEQDVNREIDQIQISNAKVITQIGQTIFQDILDIKRFNYCPFENRKGINYSFDVASWIDGHALSNGIASLGVRLLTPYFDEADSVESIVALSAKEQQVIVVLGENSTYYEDMLKKIKIQEYIRSHSTQNESELIKNILNKKVSESNELSKSIKVQLIHALEEAACYVNGVELKISTNLPNAKIANGLDLLIESIYPKLSYVVKQFQVEQLNELIKYTQGNIFGDQSEDVNFLATNELIEHIDNHTEHHAIVILGELLQKFSKKPIGWRETDILASLIYLLKDEKVIFKLDNRKMSLKDAQFVRTITKRHFQEKIILSKRKVIEESHLRTALLLVKDTVGLQIDHDKEDILAQKIRQIYKQQLDELEKIKLNYQYRFYPGENVVDNGIKEIKRIYAKEDTRELFQYLFEAENDILAFFEDFIPIRNFFEHHTAIYDTAMKLKERYRKDVNLLTSSAGKEAGKRLESIMKNSEPYSMIKELPSLNEQFRMALTDELEQASEPVIKTIQNNKNILIEDVRNSEKAKEKLEKSISHGFSHLKKRAEEAQTLSELNALKFEIEDLTKKYLDQIQGIKEEEQQIREMVHVSKKEILDSSVVEKHVKPLKKELSQRIFQRQDIIPRENIEIKNYAELDDYLSKIKSKIETELKLGKIVKIL